MAKIMIIIWAIALLALVFTGDLSDPVNSTGIYVFGILINFFFGVDIVVGEISKLRSVIEKHVDAEDKDKRRINYETLDIES